MGRYAFWSLEKRCGRCGLTVARKHAAEHFHPCYSRYDGLQAYCKTCMNEATKQWAKARRRVCAAS